MRRVIPLTVFRKITFVRPGSVFTPRCSARWNQAIRMETCWSVCARTLTFGLFRCAAKQTCMRAISLQRHFVNIGGRIVPSMREGFLSAATARWYNAGSRSSLLWTRRRRHRSPKSSITLKNIQSRCPCALSARRTDFSGSWARRELLDCSASGRSRGKRIIPRLSSACFLQIQRYVPNCGVCCMSGMSRRRLKSSIASPTGTSLDTNHPGCACCI